jgi:hypothetical protein
VIDPKTLKPGDVICVGTHNFTGWWIRLRSLLLRKPHLQNHIAMFTHWDGDGNPRGLEGKPSSFGWVNLSKYLSHPSAVSNAGKTTFPEWERTQIVSDAERLMGRAYDWFAILALATELADKDISLAEWPSEGLPSQVTCSSAMDYLYEAQGWPNPGGTERTRVTDVDDWVEFIEKEWP